MSNKVKQVGEAVRELARRLKGRIDAWQARVRKGLEAATRRGK